jgi:asparagine synthase (glutamine-hydrolysing)
MCGIAGVISHTHAAAASRTMVASMLEELRHRGPDDSKIVEAGPAVLGNVRLSLVDRAHGTQPMSSADGAWHLTYNGEVYNWRELRRELSSSWEFRTHCDTEVVLAALASWGAAALRRFNGMFALFLWNNVKQEGLAARDRLGVKPFVYSSSSDAAGFAFASEAKALVRCSAGSVRADFEAIGEYLAAPMFSGVERPMFAGFEHLLPGQLLRVTRTGVVRETW